jgi:large subunit ribosomal protein L23
METTKVIIKPLITEKSLVDAAKGDYSFLVDRRATKGEIKKAVKEKFSVDVVSVKTRTTKGRTRRVFRRREKTELGPRKTATVRVGKEQKIDIFEVKG